VAGRDEFLAHALDLLEPLGRVHARGMFGGHGLYCDGVFFGIALDNMLYLKADDRNRGEFERAGSEMFSYSRKGKRATLNFYRAPEEALDAVKEYLILHGFDIHQSTGANRTIIGVIGDTDALDAREIEAMPGVSQVVRIRKDD